MVSYTLFLETNRRNYDNVREITTLRVDKVNFAQNVCTFDSTGSIELIDDVVSWVMNGSIALTNPSKLQSWRGFSPSDAVPPAHNFGGMSRGHGRMYQGYVEGVKKHGGQMGGMACPAPFSSPMRSRAFGGGMSPSARQVPPPPVPEEFEIQHAAYQEAGLGGGVTRDFRISIGMGGTCLWAQPLEGGESRILYNFGSTFSMGTVGTMSANDLYYFVNETLTLMNQRLAETGEIPLTPDEFYVVQVAMVNKLAPYCRG